jgi:hypothetical protein
LPHNAASAIICFQTLIAMARGLSLATKPAGHPAETAHKFGKYIFIPHIRHIPNAFHANSPAAEAPAKSVFAVETG